VNVENWETNSYFLRYLKDRIITNDTLLLEQALNADRFNWLLVMTGRLEPLTLNRYSMPSR
jgi:hypothetical protein